jgi:hypothetical protein
MRKAQSIKLNKLKYFINKNLLKISGGFFIHLDITTECFKLCALSFKLSGDAPVSCDNGDGGYNCSDGDSYDDSAGNAHDHDNDLADGALVALVDGVHHDVEAAEVGAAD